MNAGVRGIALGARFVLVFALARFLEPADLGLYGLVFVTISYTQFVLGLDFYVYANRELIGAQRDTWTVLLRDQGAFYLTAYAIVLPLSLLLFSFNVLPWDLVGWFLALLVLEHLAHELSRTLIAMSRQVLATTVLFLRAGAWVLVLVPVMWLDSRMRTLETVLILWGVGAFLACVLGLNVVLRAGRWDWRRPVNFGWIAKGVRVATPLLVATLAVKGLTTFDRYWVETIGGLEVLGAYVLFIGIANAVKVFLDAGVFQFTYPGLIRAARRGDEPAFRNGMRRMTWQALVVATGMALVILVSVQPLLNWIDRPVYQNHIVLLYWALAAMFLYAAAMVFHYGIYAHHKDRQIVLSHLTAFIVFMAAVVALRPLWGVVSVPISICLA
ncbi:MAG: lipopolysaccharide biosynthesis protein, partial [Gammaproteobacteria bacterium]